MQRIPALMTQVAILSAALLLPFAAAAQIVTQPPAVNQDGIRDYCIYANELYSIGSQICIRNSNVAMRCVNSESRSAGRAFWSFDSKEWPMSPGLRCNGS
jgi:hypothetical protein